MSSNSFDATIELAPQPSVRAVMALFWVHTLPLVLLLVSPLEQWLMTVLVLGVGASWWWLRRHRVFGYGPKALVRLLWHTDGAWSLETLDGERLDGAQLHASTVVMGVVMVLNFELAGGGRRTRVLLGDELDADTLASLRARLSVSKPV